jgi:molecular chaperone GrpE
MGKTNGKPEVEPQLDAERELPEGEGSDVEEMAGEPRSSEIPGERSAAEPELRRVTAERDELLDRLARLQAEFENARKRAAREQGEFREYAVADAVKPLLPILDSFERALKTPAAPSEFRSGVELIFKQLLDALKKIGVEPVAALGRPFDPHLHEAVQVVDSDKVPDHHVLEELQRGYRVKDRLLRPAMVLVARNPKK